MFTNSLNSLSSKNVIVAGGKGASLGEMIKAGIPVPGGFVVLSTTFDYFIDKTGLDIQIQGILDKVDHKTISSVEGASENIQALIMSFPMPEEIEKEIYTSYDTEKLDFVAVRSSATAEDGAEHAWAGQLDSYLNTTRATLIEKVRRCRASLFTPRAIFYRFEKDLHKDHISVAVVVQKMVQSEISGIAFSVHPVTQDRNQMIIEAGYGLGEAIVSGSVTPDSYVVRKDNSDIDITVNHQQKALYKAEQGGNERVQLEDKGKQQILTKDQILELAKIILSIENHYGFPCDIEWAYEDEVFYIVQSRPITTITQDTRERFEKTYTRDTTLIIQQAWNDVFVEGFVAEGIHNPYEAPVIHYMQGGTIEIWENETCTHYYLDELLKKHSESDAFYHKIINRYLQILSICEQRRKEKHTTDIKFLKDHVQMIFDEMKGFVTFYFAGYDERVPESIRENALKVRESDSFFASNDKYIRESLIHIYPHLKGYESCILWQEIDNPPSIEELQKRRESFLVQGTKHSAHVTIEEYASQHQNYYFHIEQVTAKEDLLQGQTGYAGRVRGKVFILLRNDQVQDVQEGDIIVSPMTTPEHIPAMQKATAFITDEGGITCHAAIVARELKKPCVIGTKFATQLLKNGDFVEVDADNGVVRILQRKADVIERDGKMRNPAITRNMSFIHQCLTALGHYNNSKDFGINVKQQQLAYISGGTETTAFVNPENMKLYVGAIMSELSTYEKIESLKNKYEIFANDLMLAVDKLNASITYENWDFFCKQYQRYSAGLFLTSVIGRAGGEKLQTLLKEKGYSDIEIPEMVGAITYPSEHTPLFFSQLDLLHIGSLVQKQGLNEDEIEKLLKGWLEKYSHIPVNRCDDPRTAEDAQNQLKILLEEDCSKKHDDYKNAQIERIKNAKKILESINDETITILSYAIAEGTYLNELRKNRFSIVSLKYRHAFSYIANILGSTNWRDIFFLTPEEVGQVLQGAIIDIKEIVKKRQKIAFVATDNGIIFMEDSFVDTLSLCIENLHGGNSKNQENIQGLIKGYSANKGKITGVARLILSSKDFSRISRGEILVTTMTSVDFVPIMEKAGAFVTNEGGITSHASIVAREMNKPCIIGTQNATALISDGDLVEVDADNGVVKILSKATPRREKVLQRNFPPLAWTTGAVYEFNGYQIGPMTWGRKRETIIKYTTVQSYLIQDPSAYYISNIIDVIQQENAEFEKEMDRLNAVIYDGVRSQPGYSLADLEKLQRTHIDMYGLMLIGFDVAIDVKTHLDSIMNTSDVAFDGYVMTPWDKTAIQREQEAMVDAIEKGVNNKMYKQLESDYGYIHQDYLGKPRNEDNYKDVIENKKINPSHMDYNYDMAHLSTYQQFLIRIFKKLNYMYEEGRNAMVRCTWAMKKMAEVLGLDPESLLYMTSSELLAFTQGKCDFITPELREARKEAFALYFEDGEYSEYSGITEIEKLIQREKIMHFWNMEVEKVKTFKGNTAFPGKVVGKARLVFTQEDSHHIQPGEIMIAPMTQVEFLSGIRICGGIITDEGGIICHAAIVSREFGKPCVLATQIATKVIKTGDIIELDATNGTVRILEKDRSIATLCEKKWKKNWAGSWSLLSANYLAYQYTKQLKDITGISLDECLIITREGLSSCYFIQELKDDFGQYFANQARNNPDIIEKRCSEFTTATDEALSTISNLLVSDINKENFETYIRVMYQYGIPHRIVKVSTDYIQQEILSNYLQKLEYARVYAEPVYEKTEQYMHYLAESLGQKYNIEPHLILAMTKRQFEELFYRGIIPEKDIVHKQYELGVLYMNSGVESYHFDNDAFAIEYKINDVRSDTLSGQIAYAGKIIGRVVVVLDAHNFDDKEIQEGDILVTGMTRPEYLPLVKKCGAFITDAGGTLSHAAITAREMKKPCIIGTEVATKLLKNGDLVEVDADNGVVKTLEKAQNLYKFFYESQGYTLILEDLIINAYVQRPTKVIAFGTHVRKYVPESTIQDLYTAGLQHTKETIAKTTNTIKQLINKVKEYKVKDQNIVVDILNDFKQILSLYSYFDTAYTEGIFQNNSSDERAVLIDASKNVIRDDFDYLFFREDGVLYQILHLLENKKGISFQDVMHYTYTEIVDLVEDDKKVSIEEIQKRKSAYIYNRDADGNITFICGKNAIEVGNKFLESFESNDTSQTVKGTVAHKTQNKITGRVCIIHRDYSNLKKLHQDMEAMQHGDILVTTITDPEFVPAIQKAGAIITDIGGLLSHAAISAREFNVTCIVGTENATKVLKNGDHIEIDTNNGSVRILS